MEALKDNKFELPDPELDVKGELLIYLLYFFLFVGSILAAKGNPLLAIVIGMALGFYYVFRIIYSLDEEEKGS